LSGAGDRLRSIGHGNVLITIPISHFCEKARWALDRARIQYEERRHVQVIHAIAARRAGGNRSVPVLVCEDGVFGESADILAYADARMAPELRIYPDDPAAAAEVRALERDFDERLGPQGRLWMYDSLRHRRDLAMSYGCVGVPAWERRFLRVGFPLAMRAIDRFLDITPATAEQATVDVLATFDEVDDRLRDGRPYLCVDRFTAADLTFSALAAAVLVPPEYGVRLPQPPELPPAAAAFVKELRARPAGAHALRMFREERRLPALAAAA
jgi:glutathione S-transferase